MKLKEIYEGRKEKKKLRAPRAKQLHDVLMTKKGGSHYNPKTDYKRSKEKAKFRKELNEQ